MKAMILAAGRGERLRPLTDRTPKPLIKVGGEELVVRHIKKLKEIGIIDIVVNSAHLHEQIEKRLGDGAQFGVHITHSVEGPGGLETAGGIIKALPYLGDDPFLTLNADTLMDADYGRFLLPKVKDGEAHLFLTKNPPHHPQGDFDLTDGKVLMGSSYTFSGAAVYSPKIFASMPVQRLPLRPVFERLSLEGRLKGEVLCGAWFDVGTVQRLNEAEQYMTGQSN